jgi:LuxR family maltose regulon positive regulatory protein
MASRHVILRSKLIAPALPPGHVPRDHLFAGLEPLRRLTLVCAPPGFGKTSATVAWLQRLTTPFAWLSLDRRDNDAARFLVHLAAALQTVAPGFAGWITEAADRLRDTDVPVLVERLVNELHEIPAPAILVLDDYHVIADQTVHALVEAMIEHLPPGLSIVIVSRQDPTLPVARWRLRGQVAELGEGELRFSRAEAEAFLNGTMALGLTPEQVAVLERRSEGWVGGLQLAALSLARRADRDAFLDAFAGRDRYVMDYLVAEVLEAQPPDIRRFLLRSAVLERMNASLCAAVTGLEECGAILERLERGHVFVVALDPQREWFRYHHLFADLLRHQLALAPGERAADCHAAASDWFEAEGAIVEAAEHALAAGDSARVAALIERHGWELMLSGRSKQVYAWVQQVPERLLFENAGRLSTALWNEYNRTGSYRRAWRERLEQLIRQDGTTELGRAIRSELTMIDAIEAGRDPRRAREAIALASAIDLGPATVERPWLRTGAPAIVAACAHLCGERDKAVRAYDQAVENALECRFVTMFGLSVLGRGRLCAALGGPLEAVRRLEADSAVAARHGWDSLPLMSWIICGLAEARAEPGDLAAAATSYRRAISLARNEPSTVRHVARVGLARILWLQGEAAEAEEVLGELDRVAYVKPLMPVLPDLGVELARYRLLRGELDAVAGFLTERGLDPAAMPEGATDAEALLLGRWLILRNRFGAAIELLTRRLEMAEAGDWTDTALRCRLDLALARYQHGEPRRALDHLALVLTRAEPLGYRQIFVEAPAALTPLLARFRQEAGAAPAQLAFAESLLAARGDDGAASAGAEPAEPLSPSERRVLRLVVAGLSNRELGDRLFISENTVKTHLRHIYAKTGARNRAEAIRYAHAAGLAGAGDHP